MRAPKEVLGVLEDNGEVVLTRRNALALRLTQESASRAELSTLGVVGQLFAASLDEAALDRVATRLAVALPWIGLLPAGLHAEFIAEFQAIARACIAVASFDRLAILLEAWQATAEAYADPRLTADGSDLEYLDVPEVVTEPVRDA
ncbi:hypothetical protein CBI38_01110 [Rhodococcus oxybenzonivorans]|uniref:Prevent-host-death family protein n=1 Tax=Rhodococcus oxybenzonivorans TaxID=1990687 RepID=A0A2S2C303_9NOCA|nr:hypothetical protein [Rhodococcus oxybenzonivorans]AWK75269.1 hypothetical protein CBI38_01110 [Rhodococcus oxybenzonivorans]